MTTTVRRAKLHRVPLFAIVAGLALCVKLWLASAIQITAVYAPHDASNFVSHAAELVAGHWLGPYGEYTLIKGPFFAAFIALAALLGVPLAIAHQLLYFAACIVACIAIRPLIRDERALSAALVFILFNPYTTGGAAWAANRSEAAESTALLTVSCAAGLMLRRNGSILTVIGWSTSLGAALASYWLTREDHVWLLVPVLLLLLPLAGSLWKSPGRGAALCAAMALPFVMTILADAIVAECNARIYGWRTVTEIESPEFIGAYASIARIIAGAPKRRVPITESQLTAAYGASSAARELKPALEGAVGKGWLNNSCSLGICYGIGGGWFMWALRDAVTSAGHYDTATDARAYYLSLSSQLDAACSARRLACMPKREQLAPPMSISDAPSLLAVFGDGTLQLFTMDTSDYREGVPWSDPTIGPALKSAYDRVVRWIAPVDFPFARQRVEAADGWKLRILQAIGEAYRHTAAWLVCGTFGIVVVRLVRSAIGGFRRLDDYVIVVTALLIGAGGFLAILTLITYYSFPAFNAEYFAVVYPVVLLAIATLAAVEVPAFLRLPERGRPSGGVRRANAF